MWRRWSTSIFVWPQKDSSSRWSRLSTDMSYPQLIGYRHPVFWNDWWQYVDIDDTLRPAR